MLSPLRKKRKEGYLGPGELRDVFDQLTPASYDRCYRRDRFRRSFNNFVRFGVVREHVP